MEHRLQEHQDDDQLDPYHHEEEARRDEEYHQRLVNVCQSGIDVHTCLLLCAGGQPEDDPAEL